MFNDEVLFNFHIYYSPFQQEGCVKNQQPHAGSERTDKVNIKSTTG